MKIKSILLHVYFQQWFLLMPLLTLSGQLPGAFPTMLSLKSMTKASVPKPHDKRKN